MKAIIAVILCASLLLFSSCAVKGISSGQISELEQRIQELEKENAELKSQLGTSSEIAPIASEPSAQEGEQTIEIGETYTIEELCEFTVNYAELKKEVLPPNPGSFYTYYQENDGMTYIDVSISIKNTRTTARKADDFGTVKVICGNGYEYDTFSTIEESGGANFTYTNITNVDPLETAIIHYISSVPNELTDDSSSSFNLVISILNHAYSLNVR